VLSIHGDNVDRRTWSEKQLSVEIEAFIEEQVIPSTARRRHAG
jgi:hypothetical protein